MKKNLFLSAGIAFMVFGATQITPTMDAVAYPPPGPGYGYPPPPPPPPPRMHRDHMRYHEGFYYRRDRDGYWYRSRYEDGPWRPVRERYRWMRDDYGAPPPPPPPPHRYPRY